MCAQTFGLMGLTSSTCHYLWLHFFFFFLFFFPVVIFLLVRIFCSSRFCCSRAVSRLESWFTRHARTDHTLIRILVAYFRRGRLNSELWFVSCSLSLPLCLSTSVLGLLFTGEHTWRFWLTYTLCLPSRSSFQQTAVSNVICGGGGRSGAGPACAGIGAFWWKAMIALWSKKKQLPKRATIDLNALRSPLSSVRGCVT